MTDRLKDTLTQHVLGETYSVCDYEIDKDRKVLITLGKSYRLNSLVPENVSFTQVRGSMPSIIDGRINLDVEKMRFPYYKAIFAHEVGHALDDDAENTHSKIVRSELNIRYGREFDEFSTAEKANYIAEIARVRLQREIAAWDHGKSVAHLMGVSEEAYEEAMSDAIETYYLGEQIEVIRKIAEFIPELSSEYQLTIYNPYSDFPDTDTFGSYKLRLSELLDLHEKAVKKAYKKAGVTRNE